MKKLVLTFASLFAISLSTAFASWGHGQYSQGSFSSSVDVPATAHVQQVFQAFDVGGYGYTYGPTGQVTWPQGTYQGGSYGTTMYYGMVVNNGPLGSYAVYAGPQQYLQGDVGPGTYYIYQSVVVSGYSVTTIVW